MPGLVLSIKVSENQEVKKGDPILILEAMKMENVIKSPIDGVIKQVVVSEKQAVDKNQSLITFI
jgi:biotin carboxyl carrier protein